MNEKRKALIDQIETELSNYWSHVKSPRDLVYITTKECKGPYVTKPSETFTAIKLPHIKLLGYSHRTHIRFIRTDTERPLTQMLPLSRIDRISYLDGRPDWTGEVKTSWQVKDYIVKYNQTLGKYSCTCKGFIFSKKGKKTCKHIKEVISEMSNV